MEVTVTSPEGVPFHEVKASTGEVYVVAEAGKGFELRFKVDPQALAGGRRYAITANIDQKNVGVRQMVREHRSETTLIGFVRQGDSSGINYDLIKFASASTDEAVEADSLEFSQGKIEVILQEQKEVPGKHVQYTSGSVHKASTIPPAVKFTFRYETPTTLLLRNILRKDNPAHVAILNSFPETRIDQSEGSVMGSTAPDTNRHQQNPRVKRERDVSSNHEIVDLVGHQGVSIREAENLSVDEELVCNLISNEDALQWAKRKKPVIEIEDTQL